MLLALNVDEMVAVSQQLCVHVANDARCVMNLHYYLVDEVVNDLVDVVDQPVIELEEKGRYLINVPDVLELWHVNMQSNYFCNNNKEKKIK